MAHCHGTQVLTLCNFYAFWVKTKPNKCFTYRPLYCIKIGDGSCNYDTLERPDIRQGVHMHKKKDSPRQYALEPLFYKYGVGNT